MDQNSGVRDEFAYEDLSGPPGLPEQIGILHLWEDGKIKCRIGKRPIPQESSIHSHPKRWVRSSRTTFMCRLCIR